jgi:hypothetical protein
MIIIFIALCAQCNIHSRPSPSLSLFLHRRVEEIESMWRLLNGIHNLIKMQQMNVP